MQTTKKKPSLIFILVGAVLAGYLGYLINGAWIEGIAFNEFMDRFNAVSYTHLRAHETDQYLVCRLLLEKKAPGK